MHSGLPTKRITNTFPNDFNKFPFDKQTYKRTNESGQLNSRDCTLKQNRTSGLENNQGEVADGPQSALKNKF